MGPVSPHPDPAGHGRLAEPLLREPPVGTRCSQGPLTAPDPHGGLFPSRSSWAPTSPSTWLPPAPLDGVCLGYPVYSLTWEHLAILR